MSFVKTFNSFVSCILIALGGGCGWGESTFPAVHEVCLKVRVSMYRTRVK